MSIYLTFYKKDSNHCYQLSSPKGNENCFWLTNQDGKCGDFLADDIADVIYNALHKYVKGDKVRNARLKAR